MLLPHTNSSYSKVQSSLSNIWQEELQPEFPKVYENRALMELICPSLLSTPAIITAATWEQRASETKSLDL